MAGVRKRAGGQDDRRAPGPRGAGLASPADDLGLDADRAAALDQDARHAGVGHDPGARRGRLGEVDADPGLLGAAPAAERAAAAVAAGARVPARRRRLPAERPGAAQDDRVLGRDVGRLGDAELGLDRGDVGVPGLPGQALQAVLGRPLGPDRPRAPGCRSSS